MANFDTLGGGGRVTVRCEINAIGDDAANNRTLVNIKGRVFDSSTSLGGFGTGVWNVVLAGVTVGSGSFAYDFSGNSGRNYLFYDGNHYIGHAANGTGSASGSATFNGQTGLIGSITAGGTIGLTDYNRSPVYSDNTVVATASVGTAYSDGVSASNTSTYTVFSGALPTGLSLNASTGAITGTPTTPGVFTFVIRANGSFEGTTNTGTLTITVIGGGKVWNGTSFVAGTTRAWNGTAFVSTTTKVWNGSAWVSGT